MIIYLNILSWYLDTLKRRLNERMVKWFLELKTSQETQTQRSETGLLLGTMPFARVFTVLSQMVFGSGSLG